MNYKHLLLLGGIVLSIDVIYIYLIHGLFNEMISKIQGKSIKTNKISFALVYLVLIFQLYYFIINKNASYLDAFLLGMTTYGIFDLTNFTIFDNYSLNVSIIDVLWGGILYASSTYIFRLLERKL